MADLKTAKTSLVNDIDHLEEILAKKKRELQKLDSVQDISEPDPGTVLLFSRPLAGGTKKYTFVAFRTWDGSGKWSVTGKANTLNLLGLSEAGNTWDQLLLAIGSAKVKQATDWVTLGYKYYRGRNSGAFYRVLGEDIEVLGIMGKWRTTTNIQLTSALWDEIPYSEVRGEVR